jgi:hypothetical protein
MRFKTAKLSNSLQSLAMVRHGLKMTNNSFGGGTIDTVPQEQRIVRSSVVVVIISKIGKPWCVLLAHSELPTPDTTLMHMS